MPIKRVKSGWKWGSKGPFKTREKAAEVARAVYAHGYKKSLLLKALENLEKQYGEDIATASSYSAPTGYHKHSGFDYWHPISRHHRHSGQLAGIEQEFTVPEPKSEEEEEEQESFGADITVTDIARAYNITPDSLRRALAQAYGIKEGSFEGVGAEVYRTYADKKTGVLRQIKIRELVPSQVRVAHLLAPEIARRAQSRTKPVKIIRPGK